MTRVLTWTAAVALSAVVFAAGCFAASPFNFKGTVKSEGDINVVDEDYRVKEGETVNGNLNVVKGDVEVLGTVNGDVNVVMGDVTVEGRVNGNINAASGDIELGEKAVVAGDVNHFLGKIMRAPGAMVGGRVNSMGSWGGAKGFSPDVFQKKAGRFGVFFRAARILIFLMILALAPAGVGRVASCVRRQAGQACLVGLGVMLSALPLIVLLVITIIGILLVPIVPLVYVAAGFLGWLGVSRVVGAKVFEVLGKPGTAAFAQGAVGMLLLEAALWLLPGFFAFFVWFILQAFGYGAVVLTKFGTSGEGFTAQSPPPRG